MSERHLQRCTQILIVTSTVGCSGRSCLMLFWGFPCLLQLFRRIKLEKCFVDNKTLPNFPSARGWVDNDRLGWNFNSVNGYKSGSYSCQTEWICHSTNIVVNRTIWMPLGIIKKKKKKCLKLQWQWNGWPSYHKWYLVLTFLKSCCCRDL